MTIESEEVLIEIMQDQEPEVAIESIKGDCYNDGYDSGKFVNRYGALFLGFVGGYKAGPIGWYLVKSIVNASNPQPPDLEINALDGDCKNEYKKGFKKEYVYLIDAIKAANSYSKNEGDWPKEFTPGWEIFTKNKVGYMRKIGEFKPFKK